VGLAVVRDLRDARAPASPEELAEFETDVLAGFVLARAAAGLSDGTISSDVVHLEQVRAWFGRPLWEMEPSDADVYFGKVLRDAAKGTHLSRGLRIPAAPPRPSPARRYDCTVFPRTPARRCGFQATPRRPPRNSGSPRVSTNRAARRARRWCGNRARREAR